MLIPQCRLSLVVMIGVLGLVVVLSGCEARSTDRDQTVRDQQPTTEKPTTKPTTEQPADQLATSQPADEVEERAEPKLPEWLTVMDKFDDQQPVRVDILAAADRRLAIDTHNVQRLKIERANLPLETNRSISLQLDGQGLEWRSDSTVTIFERLRTGEWVPVKADGR